MDTKKCTKCGERQTLGSFAKNKRTKDGYNFWCKSCFKEYRAANREALNAGRLAWSKKNPEKERAIQAKSKAKNKAKRLDYNKKYYQENKQERLSYGKDYYNKNKDSCLKIRAKWKRDNPDRRAAHKAGRRAAQIQRTPSWANDQLIAAYYKEAKRLEELTGIQFHVDHIIPLQGELVSGLHVETNLQLLPAHENLGKSNSFDPMTFCA